MYFQFLEFYKRDVYFGYNDDKNDISQYDFSGGIKLDVSSLLHYDVDKIDSYIRSYDVLPTFGAPLVSERFKQLFADLEGSELEFFQAQITDVKGNIENGFYALNILKKIPCMDRQRSITEETSYGTLKIKKLFIRTNALELNSIVRMDEHESYIIVSENFKNRCEKADLKGFDFIEEGHSIYTNI
jgi:hypothetical protein